MCSTLKKSACGLGGAVCLQILCKVCAIWWMVCSKKGMSYVRGACAVQAWSAEGLEIKYVE